MRNQKLKICFIGKAPPIQGGVSCLSYSMAQDLAKLGHQVWFVTNADDVEPEFKMTMDKADFRGRNLKYRSGGLLKIISSPPSRYSAYIPWAKPFVTSLSALATEVVRENKCDVIFSYYFEPYGIAASLTSAWTRVPYCITHAGSDLGKLFFNPALNSAYVEMCKNAKYILTDQGFEKLFLQIGVKRKNLIYKDVKFTKRSSGFTQAAKPIDINQILKAAVKNNPNLHPRYVECSRRKIDSKIPIFGMYGKIHKVKGSFELLEAAAILKKRNRKIQLAIVGSEVPEIFDHFVSEIDRLGLTKQVWLIPFVTQRLIPGFIKSVTAICFLERDFGVTFHTPSIPQEVFQCGQCLILARKMYDRLSYSGSIIDGENALLTNPQDPKVLSKTIEWVMDHPEEAARIAANSARVPLQTQSEWPEYSKMLNELFLRMSS